MRIWEEDAGKEERVSTDNRTAPLGTGDRRRLTLNDAQLSSGHFLNSEMVEIILYTQFHILLFFIYNKVFSH